MLDLLRHIIAVDWSGRSGYDQANHIWLAETIDGSVTRLEPGRSRTEITYHLIDLANRDPSLIVGLDFAFSLPEWFLEQQRAPSAHELWRLLSEEALFPCMCELGLSKWFANPDWPFWHDGRPPDLKPEMRFRRTEFEVAGPGIQPKSVFQLVGGGQVGCGSLYGMQALHALSRAGFSIWPFDEPKLPLVVEIFPRTLTGAVVKSDRSARDSYLSRFDLVPEIRSKAINSEDAFDALLSALVTNEHVEELRDLQAEPEYHLEGKIWRTARQRPPAHGSALRISPSDLATCT
jgi:hypothetical protein